MTAMSTILSVVMLPLNLLLYGHFSFDEGVLTKIEWPSLFAALGVVILAVVAGIIASATLHSYRFNYVVNAVGNVTGLALVVVAIVMALGNSQMKLFSRNWSFYVGVAFPCVAGLMLSNIITVLCNLRKPERV